MSTEQLKPHSAAWFSSKVAEVKERVEGYPEHIKANMVEAAAALPTLNRRAPSQPVSDAWADGVQSAADLLKRMAVELVTERGETDPDTGAIQFNSAATREWHASLCELAEEIERLKPATPSQEPVTLTDREVGDCIDKTNRESQCGTHHFGWFLDFSANIIAALRAKGALR